jgi:hypothetical protein
MLARLGNVLYWTGCLLGILLVSAAVAFYSLAAGERAEIVLFSALFIGLGVVVWLIGRACRYVLAGH